MRKFLFIIFIIQFTGCVNKVDTKLHKKCIYPTIMISDGIGSGSGVVVKSVRNKKTYLNYALTVAHLFSSEVEYFAVVGVFRNWSSYERGDGYLLDIIYMDKDKDIALISFETERPLFVADVIKNPDLYIGNDICRVGCGLNEPFRIDFGKITSIKSSNDRPIPTTRDTYRISAPTIDGDSGGPVYYQYKLIGLTQCIRTKKDFFYISQVNFMSYVIPIERFLECEEISKHLK